MTNTKTLTIVNPADGLTIDTVELKSKEDLSTMVDAAVKAQLIWSKLAVYERAELLYKFADLIDAKNDELAKLIATESGKPVIQGSIEAEDGANILRGNVERAKHLYGDVLPASGPGLEHDVVFTRREPIGVVAAIVPFNFPMEVTFHKIGPALAMGNSVLLKAPSYAPLAILSLEKLAEDAGLPPKVLQVFTTTHDAMNESIVDNTKVDVLSMTGSTASGVKLMQRSAPSMKKLMLELGGNDPFLIFEDVDLDEAVEEMVTRFYNNGQICCAPKRFLVQRGIYDDLLEKLIRKIDAIPRGSALEENAEITTLVTEEAAIKVEEQIKACLEEGATLAYGGTRSGARIEPTVITGVTREMAVAKDMEIFGPVIPLIAFDTEDEAVEIANSSVYGLSAAMMTSDMNRSFRVAARLQAGTVVQNGSCVYRHLDQPFGGVKMSGIGREGIGNSPEEYSQLKTHVLKGVLNCD